MSERWCKCMDSFDSISISGYFGTANRGGGCYFENKQIQFCPICGTPRPTAPKRLAEKLREKYTSPTPSDYYNNWHAVALCAVEEVERLIDGLAGWINPVGQGTVNKDDIKDALRGLL